MNLMQRRSKNVSIQTPLEKLKTIYLGGGTPSLVSPHHIEQIIQSLKTYFIYDNDEDIEFTIELDPGTFDKQRVQDYASLGINRLSLGVQSLNTEVFNGLGRSHTINDIYKSIEILSSVPQFSDLSRVSFDLIFGLPNQSLNIYDQTLNDILQLKPGHISIYSLELEPGSAFGRKYKAGIAPLPSSEQIEEFYNHTSKRLTQSHYTHYEVSSFCRRDNLRGKHNSMYWRGDEPFLGFGMGAASLFESLRFSRPRTLKTYSDWVEKIGSAQSFQEAFAREAIGEMEGSLEHLKSVVMGRLRVDSGLNLDDVARYLPKRRKRELHDFFEPYRALDLVSCDGSIVKLTIPKGYLSYEEIVSRLFAFLEDTQL